MTRQNLAYFDDQYGHLAIVKDDFIIDEIETTRAHKGRYIRIDDSRNYPQLCAGGTRSGHTLEWANDETRFAETFARDCNARLFKTPEGYERAKRRVTESA